MSGVSPSAPGEQVLSPAAQKHAQGPEGPSPGVQRGAVGGKPRRSSSGRGTLAWPRPSAVGALVMSSKTAVPISLRLPAPCERHLCTSSGTQSARSRGRPGSGLQAARDCLVEHRPDRPLIVVILPLPWGRARRNRTEHASHPMDLAEDLVEGLCKGPGTPAPGWTRQRRPGDFEPRGLAVRALRWLRGSCPSGIRSS